MTKDQIYQRIVAILEETFEVEPEAISMQARLYDDLEIDSIDAVDLIVQLRPLVGRRIEPEAFKSVRTVADVVDAVHSLLSNPTHA
jgi:acyl carrier protein